jgi:hypothetical protein
MTIEQASELLASALELAGGFDFRCNVTVPFVVVPGLIMQTVIGAVYPEGFSVAVQTISPPADMENAISAVTVFTDVVNSGPDVEVEIVGYPQQTSASVRRKSSCAPGMEWRYSRIGAPPEEACKCPANPSCSGGTSCSFEPLAEDSWVVIAVNATFCTGVDNATTVRSQKSPDDDFALSIGLGLGLGLLFSAFLGATTYYVLTRRSLEVPKAVPSHSGSEKGMDSLLEQQERKSFTTEIVFVDMSRVPEQPFVPSSDVLHGSA